MARVVVGVGNLGRGDDGAGLEVARRCGGRPMAGDLSALGWCWEAGDDVVVVDAMVSGGEPGTVGWFERDELPPSMRADLSSHGLGVAEALEVAALMGRLPQRLRIVGIEGSCFDHGAPISPAVRSAIAQVVTRLAFWSGPAGHAVG